MVDKKDKIKIKIIDLLRAHPEGLTIMEMVNKTKLTRNTLLTRLHKLIGLNKVGVRQINMKKIHTWKQENEPIIKKKKDDVKVVEIKKENIKELENKEKTKIKDKITKNKKRDENKIDVQQIKREVEEELKSGKISNAGAKVKIQREPIKQAIGKNNLNSKKTLSSKKDPNKKNKKSKNKKYILTGVPGFDELFTDGIPAGNSILVAGGAGSGKTILSLQTLKYQANQGKKCLYMSFEENKEKLIEHMNDFGWNPKDLLKKDKLKIQRFNPFDITRNVDALLAKQKGELLIDINPIIIPKGFKPDFICVDSLTAIASAFTGKEESYRIYIEQLFRFFEKIGATSFLITETEQIPKIFSKTGVEEFLADGVIVLYNIKHGNVRENAIEVLKLRGADHEKKIVSMQITENGIVVYPNQQVFEDIISE